MVRARVRVAAASAASAICLHAARCRAPVPSLTPRATGGGGGGGLKVVGGWWLVVGGEVAWWLWLRAVSPVVVQTSGRRGCACDMRRGDSHRTRCQSGSSYYL